jgi:hypothetical protein
VVLADTLNGLLGLPGNATDRILARRDKALMAEVVARAGLATPGGKVCRDAEDAATWFVATGLTPRAEVLRRLAG